MAFRMTIAKERIEGKDALPAGIYELKLVGFKPKFSKPNPQFPDRQPSLNLNAQFEVVNHPEHDGAKVYEGLNENASWVTLDFCHALGLPLETDGTDYWMPGTWDSDPGFDPMNAETYKYEGPLLGRVAKVELGTEVFNNKTSNKVRRYFCAVEDCATKFPEIKHRKDLLTRKK